MSGNGVDLASIYGAIMAVSAELKAFKAEVAAEFRAVRAEMADLPTRSDLAALREEVRGYHASVVGHGIMLSEHEERIGRLERGEVPRAN